MPEPPTVNTFQELYEAYGSRKRVAIFMGDDRGNYFAFPALITKFDLSQPLQEAVTASIELVVARGFTPRWINGGGSVSEDLAKQPYTLGMDCVLKYSLSGLDEDEPSFTGARDLPVKDLSLSDSMGMTDSVTDRTAGGFVQRAATLRDITLSGTLVYNINGTGA